jgi:hypothetical protein
VLVSEEELDSNLCFLEKVNAETYLIGNQYQLDLISITGVFDNKIETDLNWTFALSQKFKKVTVDTKSTPCLMKKCCWRWNCVMNCRCSSSTVRS